MVSFFVRKSHSDDAMWRRKKQSVQRYYFVFTVSSIIAFIVDSQLRKSTSSANGSGVALRIDFGSRGFACAGDIPALILSRLCLLAFESIEDDANTTCLGFSSTIWTSSSLELSLMTWTVLSGDSTWCMKTGLATLPWLLTIFEFSVDFDGWLFDFVLSKLLWDALFAFDVLFLYCVGVIVLLLFAHGGKDIMWLILWSEAFLLGEFCSGDDTISILLLGTSSIDFVLDCLADMAAVLEFITRWSWFDFNVCAEKRERHLSRLVSHHFQCPYRWIDSNL